MSLPLPAGGVFGSPCHTTWTGTKKVNAVTQFPVPTSTTQVRQFVGLTSYYRRFIESFAAPLHNLTRKDVEFRWTTECQEAFDTLKKKMVEAPVLVYPNFDLGFTLETDANYQGLGAVLSQKLEDQRLHPVAFGSRALSPPEKNYAVTELETWPLFGLSSIFMPTSMVMMWKLSRTTPL